MKHEETYGEIGETCRKLPPSGFLSHLVTSFQVASQDSLPIRPYEQIST